MPPPLLRRLFTEIEQRGSIGFGRFMELALYDPDDGFYRSGGAGRRRDFITSPEVGPLFGLMMATALDSWWNELGRPDQFTFVEVGAGRGTLARSILAAAPSCLGALDYIAVETGAEQRSDHPDGVTSRSQMPARVENGVVFANELLDNMPCDLLELTPDGTWLEIRVGRSGDELVEVAEAAVGRPAIFTEGVEGVGRIPDQFAARAWLAEALARLEHGRLVVIDYTVPTYPSEPGREWLRTYRAHDRGGRPLDAPGSQDLTVDVAIDQLRAVAEPTSVASQDIWLARHGINELVDAGRRYWRAHAARPDVRALEARSRIGEAEALLDPAGLGGFSVLEWAVPSPS